MFTVDGLGEIVSDRLVNEQGERMTMRTKTGKTTGALIWLFEQALFAPARHDEYRWVAPSSGQARMAFDRLVRMLPPHFGHARRSSPPTLRLPNGQIISFRTGEDPDLLYGADVGAVVLDEYTRMREEAWVAIQSTLTATNGPARLVGNVRGTLGWGFRLARKAEDGDPDWHYMRMTWRGPTGRWREGTPRRSRRRPPASIPFITSAYTFSPVSKGLDLCRVGAEMAVPVLSSRFRIG